MLVHKKNMSKSPVEWASYQLSRRQCVMQLSSKSVWVSLAFRNHVSLPIRNGCCFTSSELIQIYSLPKAPVDCLQEIVLSIVYVFWLVFLKHTCCNTSQSYERQPRNVATRTPFAYWCAYISDLEPPEIVDISRVTKDVFVKHIIDATLSMCAAQTRNPLFSHLHINHIRLTVEEFCRPKIVLCIRVLRDTYDSKPREGSCQCLTRPIQSLN